MKTNYRGVECELVEDNSVIFSVNGKPLLDRNDHRLEVDTPSKLKGFIDCLVAIGYI